MKDIQQLLREKKKTLDQMEVPEELEERLNKAITKARPPKEKKGLIAVALVFFLLFTYNFDAIANYGKQFMGYDEVISVTLRDLNEMGQGQEINKSHTFSNGVKVTLDGVMVDDNQLVAFYSINNETGEVDGSNMHFMSMKGLFDYHMSSGSGIMNDSNTEIKWVQHFAPPKFFERNLNFQFSIKQDHGNLEQGEIKFKLDRRKAMGSTIKQKIGQTIRLGENKVYFENITASPTITIIEGSIDTRLDLLRNSKRNTHPRFQMELEMYVNGEIVEQRGAGLSSSLKGYTFEGRFDALPKDIKKLEIKLVGLTSSKPVGEVITLEGEDNFKFDLLGREITIKEIKSDRQATYITIVTDEDVLLEQVHLLTGEDRISLEKTISTPEGLTKNLDGSITHQRTLRFLGTGDDLKLEIGKIRSLESLDKLIEIPVN